MTSRTHILLIDVHDEEDESKEGFFVPSSQFRKRKKNVCCATRSVDIKHIIAFNENHSPFFAASLFVWMFCVGHPTVHYQIYLFNETKGS